MTWRTRAVRGGLVVAGVVGLGGLLGGCGSGPSRETLRQMPYETAWLEVEDAAAEQKQTGAVVKLFSRGQVDPDEFLTDQLEKQTNAARAASTPNEAIEAMADDVAAYMIERLPRHAMRNGVTTRINVAMGKLVNRRGDEALDQGLTLIQERLLNNVDFEDRFRLISSDNDAADAILREVQGNPTYGSPSQSESYDWRDLYIATGETWINREFDGRKITINVNIEASHPQSREKFGIRTFRRTYYFHPGFGRYITEAKNDELKSTYVPG